MTPGQFAECLIAYCAWAGGSVTSWGRSPERNEAVGGHADSSHLVWLGADIGYWPNPEPDLEIAQRRARRLGMKLVRESDHDHLQAL